MLPGISEVTINIHNKHPESVSFKIFGSLVCITQEMLFRGALMPLLGTNWNGIVAVGLIFGLLHLGSGRKYSFAVW